MRNEQMGWGKLSSIVFLMGLGAVSCNSGSKSGISQPSVAPSAAAGGLEGVSQESLNHRLLEQDNVGQEAVMPKSMSTRSAGPFHQKIGIDGQHACAIQPDETLICWGSNDGNESNIPTDLGRVTSVFVGYGYTCAVQKAGNLRCWGNAILNSNDRFRTPSDLGKVASVKGNFFGYLCAIKLDDRLRCWIPQWSAMMGDIDVPSDLGAVTDVGFGRVSGEEQICAIQVSGRLRCWKTNSWAADDIVLPNSLSSVISVTSKGEDEMCWLQSSGGVKCWSFATKKYLNSHGDLGAVTSLSRNCAVLNDGEVKCWGEMQDDRIPEGLRASSVVDDGATACAVKLDGSVVCWGRDREGATEVPAGLILTQF